MKTSTRHNIKYEVGLSSVRFDLCDNDHESSPRDVFNYKSESVEESSTDGFLVKLVEVDRVLDNTFKAKLRFVVIILASNKTSGSILDDVTTDALNDIANHSSHVLSTITSASFSGPIITPPIFDNEE